MSDLLKLKPHLVPKSLWGISAQRKLGASWKHIRQECLVAAAYRCQICSESPSRPYCHEVWDYSDIQRTATLIGFEIHCTECDLVTHIGRAMKRGFGEAALEQMCKVNGITRPEAEKVYADAIRVWNKRKAVKWRVVVDQELLKRFPRLAILEDNTEGRQP
jgi:hypothetical protein